MRLRKFVKTATAAFSSEDIKRGSPQLYEAVKKMSAPELKKLLFSSEFVPLDLVALAYHTNRDSFLEALHSQIMFYIVVNPMLKRQMDKMGEDPKDMASQIMKTILSEDPSKRGLLNQIILDGSRAKRYRYGLADDPITSTVVKNSLQSTQNNLVVPHCPYCKQAGVDKPLWDFSVKNGQIESMQGMQEDKCTTTENINSEKTEDQQGRTVYNDDGIQVKELENDNYLVSKGNNHYEVTLTDAQKKEIEEGLRFFEVSGDNAHLRCTFQAHIPSFSAFISSAAVRSEVSKAWQAWARKHGQSTNLKRFDRLKVLEEKLVNEGLSPKEMKELRKERRYKHKRDKVFIPGISSLDAPLGGKNKGDSTGRALQEEISKDPQGELSEDAIREAEFALQDVLDESDFALLGVLRRAMLEFMTAVNNLKQYYESGSEQDKDKYNKSLLAVSGKLLVSNNTQKRNCLTCGLDIGEEDKVCPAALRMHKDLNESYQASKNINEFNINMQKMDPHVMKHYEKSGVGPFVESLFFLTSEVSEDDDLSFEDDFGQEPKLNFNDFKAKAFSKMTAEQQAHFNGTIVPPRKSKEVKEKVDPSKTNEVASKVDELIRKVDEEDLTGELITYLRA